jgi:hypothetical protein
MPTPRITQIISSLPFEKKLIGTGSILMVISLFFPWYQDLDSFHTGDTFSGLTGPLYLGGFTFLILASLSILFIIADHFDKKIPLFNFKTSRFYLWSGIFSFYLLFLIGSVYFHPAFGVNITMKQSQFGIFIAYISASLLTIGGYLSGRERKTLMKEFEAETREPVIKIPNPEQRKPRENLRNIPVTPPQRAPVPQQPAMDLNMPVQAKVQVPVMQNATAAEPVAADIDTDRKNPQPFRMDL